MASGPDTVLRQVRRLFGAGTLAGLAEGPLLERFLARRDEAAFEALLARLGPMVLGVCRRALRDPGDVEDAFQATFLILVRRGGTLRDRELLAPWLHRVALRVALRAGVEAARRRKLAAIDPDSLADRGAGPPAPDLRPALDEELARLPEKYRAPVVLCYLEGRTHEEAARQLRWPVGTVKGRLARARALLRGRLARRGLAPSAGLLAATLADGARAAVPEALGAATTRASAAVAAGGGLAAGSVPAAVAALYKGVLTTMIWNPWKAVAAGTLVIGLVATGAGVLARQAPGPRPITPDGTTPRVTLARQVGGPAPAAPGPAGEPKAGEDADGAADDLFLRLEEARIQLDIAKEEAEERKQAWVNLVKSLAQIEQALKDTDYHGANDRIERFGNQTRAQVAKGLTNSRERLKAVKQNYLEKTRDVGRLNRLIADLERQSSPPAIPGQNNGFRIGPIPAMSAGAAQARGGGFGGEGGFGGGGGMGMGMGIGMGMGMGGGLGGGQNWDEARTRTVETQSVIVTQSPGGDRISAYSIETGTSGSYKVPPGTKAVPIAANHLVALWMKGEEIPQVAVFEARSGKWSPEDLREPARGQAVPQVGAAATVYTIGRRVYAFGAEAGRWAVLELEDGAAPRPIFRTNTILVQDKGRLHVFNIKLARWDEIGAKDE